MPAVNIPAFVKQLKELENGKEITKRLMKEIRAEARPVLRAVRAAALGLPSRGESARRGRDSLRRHLARATVMQTRRTKAATVVVKTDPKKMPEGIKGLPPYVEGEGRWRHPVFGDTDKWVRQDPKPYFYGTVRPYEPRIQDAGERIIKQIQKELGS